MLKKYHIPILLLFTLFSCVYTRVIVVPTSVSIEDPAFYRTISGISGRQLLSGNSIQIINSGKETFRVIYDMIRRARKSVNLEVYLFRDDDLGRRMTALLCDTARRGIKVNCIIDAFGARFIGKEIPGLLKESGVRLYYYHPFKMTRYTKYFKRDHRKMVIVDGKKAVTGGFNITSEWDEDGSDKDKWRDLQVELAGPVIFQLQSIFMEHWFDVTGEVLVGGEYFPALHPAGTITARAIGSSPKSGSSRLQTIYLFALNSARRYFWMENAYFVPDKNSIRAFISAAKRGVDVRIIVPGPDATDVRAPIYAGRSYYWRLLKSGVKIYQYTKQRLHSKFAVADGIWATVGSTNFDNRSFRYHEELNINIYSRDFARKIKKIFIDDLGESIPLDIKKFRKRSPISRIKEFFSKLFEEQL